MSVLEWVVGQVHAWGVDGAVVLRCGVDMSALEWGERQVMEYKCMGCRVNCGSWDCAGEGSMFKKCSLAYFPVPASPSMHSLVLQASMFLACFHQLDVLQFSTQFLWFHNTASLCSAEDSLRSLTSWNCCLSCLPSLL